MSARDGRSHPQGAPDSRRPVAAPLTDPIHAPTLLDVEVMGVLRDLEPGRVHLLT